MKGLIYKDICMILHVMKRIFILAPILLFIVMAVVALGPGAEPVVYIIPVVMCMIVGISMIFTPFGHDESAGWLKQAFTMPVSRLDHYHAKLLVHLLCTGCTALMGIAVSLISALVFGDCTAQVIGITFGSAGGMFVLSLIIGICCNALIIWMGLRKASIVFMSVFFMIQMACVYGLVDSLFAGTENMTGWISVITAVIAGLTVLLYCLGRKWIQTKEF